ncbi:hypothetical protein METBIDRAFT_40083, partial [Metschnikowia bicuspidata var. bicuspidata NRRL YB-4993]
MSAVLSPNTKRRLLDSGANGVTQPIPKKSLQIRTNKPRPHLCAICTRGFARLEHLKRHERAHTNEKPYQCAACGRCFARRDLVLRHQQKLHLSIFQVARRGLLPATLGGASEPDAATTAKVAQENVIVLRNNTRAKAPLPDLLAFPGAGLAPAYLDLGESSPSQESPQTNSLSTGHPLAENAGFVGDDFGGALLQPQPHLKGNSLIPSPNTNSYHNTPTNSGAHQIDGSSFLDLDLLQSHNMGAPNYTQQPSPLTGDSPDLKDKQKLGALGHVHAGAPHGSQGGNPAANPRHSSFSAVSGLSYTNLQDALAIRNNQIIHTPEHVGFNTPQFTSTDLDYADMHVPDLHGANMDWCDINYHDPGRGKQKAGFKMSLNTIPSETQLANTFLGENALNHIIANHQFQNPEHPHHIPGTSPMEFGFPLADDPLQTNDFSKIQYGSGFTQLSQDLLYLQEHEATKPLAQPSPAKKPARVQTPTENHRKLGFVNEIDDLSWLEQFKGIPLPNNLPLASTDTGFVGMPFVNDEFQGDEVFSLFKFKQDDLARQRSMVNLDAAKSMSANESRPSAVGAKRPSRAMFTIGDPKEFISDELRAKIIHASHVDEDHFPPKEDLNAYMNLYGEEFNKYFLFIHLPTLKNPMVDNFENIPMILAMCAIGALYSYHDSNTLLLFNLSKFHIHKFFENEVTPNKLQLKKVPIMAHQCLVLHIFISMFLNEPDMVEITSRQMKSMVGLIKSTNFQGPLEQFLIPPPAISNPNDQSNLQNNFGYFIMAQTRIRTILTFYQLDVIRSILLGNPLAMSGSEIRSGLHCNNEELWRAGDSAEWFAKFAEYKDKSIVEVSNNQNLQELAEQLNGAQVVTERSTFHKALALLMYVHEQILTSYTSCGGNFDPYLWRVDFRPRLEYLINSWEEYFVRNGGSAIVNNQNEMDFNSSAELKLILPLLLLAKIRLSVNFSPLTATVLHRDW